MVIDVERVPSRRAQRPSPAPDAQADVADAETPRAAPHDVRALLWRRRTPKLRVATPSSPTDAWPAYSPMPIGEEGFALPRPASYVASMRARLPRSPCAHRMRLFLPLCAHRQLRFGTGHWQHCFRGPDVAAMFPSMRKSPFATRRAATAGSTTRAGSAGFGASGGILSRTGGSSLGGTRFDVTTATQLVERFPQIDKPQRVEPPPQMNAPKRKAMETMEEKVKETFTSTGFTRTAGLVKKKYDIRSYGGGGDDGDAGGGAGRRTAAAPESPDRAKRDDGSRKKLKDMNMLAFACRRANKPAQEAAAYFCQGVLYDNMDEFPQAIKQYQNFLAVCRRMGDVVGEALAYNCIGVDYHLRGQRERGAAERNFRNAIHFHTKHLAVADEQGQFVAYTNAGLAYSALERFDAAARQHQNALRVAIRLASAFGQSIAVGNLGMVAVRQGDLATAKACLDQHLSLVRGLKDRTAESNACQQLGALANASGDYEGASRYFEQARRVAAEAGAKGLYKAANCNLGVAVGNMKLEGYMKSVAERSRLGSRRQRAEPAPGSRSRASAAEQWGWSPTVPSGRGGAGGGSRFPPA